MLDPLVNAVRRVIGWHPPEPPSMTVEQSRVKGRLDRIAQRQREHLRSEIDYAERVIRR